MATVVLTMQGALTGFSPPQYYPIGSGFVGQNGNATESQSRTQWTTAGRFGILTFSALSNTSAFSSTINFRKNGSNGNQVVSIPLSTTGTFSDNTHYDDVVVNDLVDFSITNADGLMTGVSAFIDFDNQTVGQINTRYIGTAPGSQQPVSIGTLHSLLSIAGEWFFVLASHYTGLPSGGTAFQFPCSGTLTNLQLLITTNSVSAGFTWGLGKNDAPGNQSISVPGFATGLFIDTVNTDTVSVNDYVAYYFIAASGGGSAQVVQSSVDFSNANRNSVFLAFQSGVTPTMGASATDYFAFGAGFQFSSESNAKMKATLPLTLSELQVDGGSGGGGSAATVTLRKNGANGNQTISIPTNTTGAFVDNTHSDSVVASDLINLQVTTGSGSGVTFWNLGMQSVSPPDFHIVNTSTNPVGIIAGTTAHWTLVSTADGGEGNVTLSTLVSPPAGFTVSYTGNPITAGSGSATANEATLTSTTGAGAFTVRATDGVNLPQDISLVAVVIKPRNQVAAFLG